MAESNLSIPPYNPDNLLVTCDSMPVLVQAGTYKRGEVLGRISTNYGKINADGAEAAAIMPFDVTLAADQLLAVYVSGSFNEAAVIFEGATLDTIKQPLRDKGIYLRPFGAAPDTAV